MGGITRENKVKVTLTTPAVTLREGTPTRISTTWDI